MNFFSNKNLNYWLITSLCISSLILIPICVIFYNSLYVDNAVWAHIYENLFFNYTLNSLILAFAVSLLSFALGVSAAWTISFYQIPYKKILSLLLILPIAIPPYAVAYSYVDISDYFNNFFYLNFRGKMGAIFILSMTLYPYVYLISRYSFLKNAHKIMEAAANLGATRLELFFKFALPLSRPAIAASMALVIMETLADFGVVHFLGVDSLSVGIYKAWFGLEDINSSARLASILFLFTLFIVTFEKLLRRNETEKYVAYGSFYKSVLFKENRMRALFFILTLCMLALFVPIAWLFVNALSADNYKSSDILIALFNTIKLGLIGAFLIVIFALLLAFAKRLFKKTISIIFNIAKIGYAAPGIVIAIGIIIPVLYIDKKINNFVSIFGYESGLLISSTIIILLLAYLVRFFSVAFNPLEAAYEKISSKIDFVSLNLGASNNRLFFQVHIPMLSMGILIAFLLVFIDILKELPATLILRPFNFNTLSILTFEYASSEQLVMAATPALLITFLASLPLLLIHFSVNKLNS